MRSRTLLPALAATATVAAVTWATTPTAAAAEPLRTRDACPSVAPPKARCFAEVVIGGGPAAGSLAAPAGFGPADLTSAYRIPAGGSGQLVGVVEA